MSDPIYEKIDDNTLKVTTAVIQNIDIVEIKNRIIDAQSRINQRLKEITEDQTFIDQASSQLDEAEKVGIASATNVKAELIDILNPGIDQAVAPI